MLEPEMAFCDLEKDMDLAQEMIIYLLNYVLKELPEEMEFFNKFIDKDLKERLNKILEADFKRITYTEAIDILEKANKKFEYPVKWGIDLQTEHEKYICEDVYKSPVFVTDYPKDIKAFYMRLNDDDKTVAAMDLLVPGVGEIIGGSQREERLDVLKQRMKEMKLTEEEYSWYLDLREYGSVEHAGFGLGFERLIMYLSGMTNIRDVIPFPRTPKNAKF
jgi:asparaginyl-tRNA synthetase